MVEMGSVGIHPFMVETTEDRKVVGIRPVIAHMAQGPPIGGGALSRVLGA